MTLENVGQQFRNYYHMTNAKSMASILEHQDTEGLYLNSERPLGTYGSHGVIVRGPANPVLEHGSRYDSDNDVDAHTDSNYSSERDSRGRQIPWHEYHVYGSRSGSGVNRDAAVTDIIVHDPTKFQVVGAILPKRNDDTDSREYWSENYHDHVDDSGRPIEVER